MTRTVTAGRNGQWHIWGSDSGSFGYTFGYKDMETNERILAVTLPGGGRLDGSRIVFDDALAIELADGATYPDQIEITIETIREAFARMRAEAAQ